jgi:hypothetical protein
MSKIPLVLIKDLGLALGGLLSIINILDLFIIVMHFLVSRSGYFYTLYLYLLIY